MSEFYAQAAFLDFTELCKKYSLIVSTIENECKNINNSINSLKRYTSFGIETQISNLEKCRDQLGEWQKDVMLECGALKNIVDVIIDKENKAVGILGGMFCDNHMSGYDRINQSYTEYSNSSEKSFSTMYNEIIKTLTKFGKNTTKFFSGLFSPESWEKYKWLDKWKGIPREIKDAMSLYLSPIFSSLDAITKVTQTIDYYRDGNISLLDISSTADNAVSFIQSVLSIAEKIPVIGADGKTEMVKLLISKKVGVEDTAVLAGKHVGTFTQYLPVVSVILATVVSGIKTYERVSSDGEVSVNDGCEIAFDGAMDGLIVCGEALICLACPPASIGVAIFEIANYLVEKNTGTSIKDMAKDGYKKLAENLGNELRKLLGNVSH